MFCLKNCTHYVYATKFIQYDTDIECTQTGNTWHALKLNCLPNNYFSVCLAKYEIAVRNSNEFAY